MHKGSCREHQELRKGYEWFLNEEGGSLNFWSVALLCKPMTGERQDGDMENLVCL